MLSKTRNAQSTLEYALLLAVIVGALLTMQNYMKRSIQGRLQASSDEIGQQYSPGSTYRYDNLTSSIGSIVETTTAGAGGSTTTVITGGNQKQESTRNIKSLSTEKWVGKGE